MDGNDRNVRTNVEQWKVIIDYLEQNPILVRSKFENYDCDNRELKKKWDDLATFLNSMGFGSRSVEKWQLAIARWKSKTKAKAAAMKIAIQKTGGGPSKTPQLNPIEERLMCLLDWKSVTGDENIEIGLLNFNE
ncbi:unnamed protein product [Ceutorhynchus assimilis]|uniref:Regulatory protein zeste n=1 Tax=Ceutorhynchus assimilis TaxID=467358 RepID=A0A9N9QI58_9CUCU|nr:unnamed protein product [Ceutorhynchus assimilis]